MPGSREIGSGIVDDEMGARIFEHPVIDGTELSRCPDHLRLDLDCRELAQFRTAQQHVRGHSRALADDCSGSCSRSMRHCDERKKDLGRHIVAQRPAFARNSWSKPITGH